MFYTGHPNIYIYFGMRLWFLKGDAFRKHHHHQSFMTICFVHVSLALYNGNNDSLLFGIKFTFIGTDPSFPSLTSVEILNVYKDINYFSISYLSLNNPL